MCCMHFTKEAALSYGILALVPTQKSVNPIDMGK